MPDGQASRSAGWSVVTTAAPEGLSSEIKRLLVATGAIAAVSLILHLAIARIFDRLGVYFLNDILFASDTHDFLASISHGERSMRTITPDLLNSVHPYVWFYFSPFVRGLAKLAAILHLTDESVYDIRLTIGVVVIPFVATLQAVAFAILLHLLRFSLGAVIALSVVNLLTFSTLLYGSVPDHFAVTNLAITLLLIAAVSVYRWQNFDRLGLWIPLGLVTTGITSTNIAIFGIVHFFTRLAAGKMGFWRAAVHSAGLSAAILAFVLTTADFAGVVLHGTPNAEVMRHDFIGRYMQVQVSLTDRIEHAAAAIENSIAPLVADLGAMPAPKIPEEHHPVTRPPMETHAIYPELTFETESGHIFSNNPLGMIAIAAMLAGALAMLIRGGPCRLVGAVSLAIILFNLALHSLWGDEYVLYSQHWITAALMLLAGVFLTPTRWRAGMTGAVLLFALAIGVNNAIVLADVVGRLQELSTAAGWPR